MKKIKNSFDSKEELKQLNLSRLFINQKLQLKDMEYYMFERYDKNMKNNIFKSLLNDNNVNKYTKLYLILYQMNHYNRYYIPNKLIANRLKLSIRNSIRLLNMFKDKGIIKIYYIGKRRYFRFINDININVESNFDYDWLNGDDEL